jgi:hypothetical protein
MYNAGVVVVNSEVVGLQVLTTLEFLLSLTAPVHFMKKVTVVISSIHY